MAHFFALFIGFIQHFTNSGPGGLETLRSVPVVAAIATLAHIT